MTGPEFRVAASNSTWMLTVINQLGASYLATEKNAEICGWVTLISARMRCVQWLCDVKHDMGAQ